MYEARRHDVIATEVHAAAGIESYACLLEHVACGDADVQGMCHYSVSNVDLQSRTPSNGAHASGYRSCNRLLDTLTDHGECLTEISCQIVVRCCTSGQACWY